MEREDNFSRIALGDELEMSGNNLRAFIDLMDKSGDESLWCVFMVSNELQHKQADILQNIHLAILKFMGKIEIIREHSSQDSKIIGIRFWSSKIFNKNPLKRDDLSGEMHFEIREDQPRKPFIMSSSGEE